MNEEEIEEEEGAVYGDDPELAELDAALAAADPYDPEIEKIVNTPPWICIICKNEYQTEKELDIHWAEAHGHIIRRARRSHNTWGG